METPETPKIHKIEIIPDDAVITIQMSGFYIKTIQNILIALASDIGKENLIKVLDKMKNDKPPETLEEVIIFSLTTLVHTAEEAAKEQSKTKMQDFTEDEIKNIIEGLDS